MTTFSLETVTGMHSAAVGGLRAAH